MKPYTLELEGQLDFYNSYLPVIDKTIDIDDIYTDYTDGIVNGNLLEFKLLINDVNSVLFQAIKYLSARRIKGKNIPKNILLVSLNNQRIYVFDSEKYMTSIEKVYFGGASIGNYGFVANTPEYILDYKTNLLDEANLIKALKSNNFTKINIDENCIVAWAERFYNENNGASKADFIGDQKGKVNIIGEIRRPDKLKEFIHPYKQETNAQFHYLMDRLNDTMQKKNLGAFYTPKLYADKSIELVRKAIDRVPEGNDYIILDRCAGTGNLQEGLSEDELSHCVLSTIEYFEYKVLLELLGDKVRHIIPPTEREDTFNMGLVHGADALSQEYIENPVIRQYIDNPNVTIILYENPPYAETTSIEHQKRGNGASSSGWKKSFLMDKMKEEVKGTAKNDLGNVFIWSGFKYYLRQSTDSYVVYSPVKYWKTQHLIDRKFIKGFAFNRRHFHTKIDAMIMCTLWSQEEDDIDSLELEGYDIDKNNHIVKEDKNIIIRRIYEKYSTRYFDKRKFPEDVILNEGVLISLNGTEYQGKTRRVKQILNKNILGYMAVYSSGFDNPDLKASLLIAGRYDGNGFFLRRDNYLTKLPLFGASRYITYNRHWTQRSNIMKSADKYELYFEDLKKGKLEQYLLKILLFTVLETQNHMRSFTGTDGRKYNNELTFDNTNGETIASKDIKKLSMNKAEHELIDQWLLIMKEAKKTKNYNLKFNYGVYHIVSELNTRYKDENDFWVYDYPELNGHLNTLKQMIKKYYLDEIVPFLFDYEFLK